MKRKIVLSLALLVLLMPAGQALSDKNIESAVRFFKAQEYKKAIGLLKEITKEDHPNANAWVLLGNCYVILEKIKKQ